MRFRFFIAVVLLFIICQSSQAQDLEVDSSYIETWQPRVNGRIFVARKYTNINFRSTKEGVRLPYSPGSGFSLGVGANYKWLNVNLGFGFDFLNPYSDRGDTKSLDIQMHGVGRRLTIDFVAQFYKGFHLPKRVLSVGVDNDFYSRPDVSVRTAGGTLQYILNNKKFSYRAAFFQNERQLKSAGTLMVGLELYAGSIGADSSIVPSALVVNEKALRVSSIRFVEFGPNVGYSYVWVYKENFFLMGGANISLNAGINRFYDDERSDTRVGLSPNTLFRLSTGYSIGQFNINVLYVTAGLHIIGVNNETLSINSGTLRVSFVYRFKPSKKLNRYFEPVDKIVDEFKSQFKAEEKPVEDETNDD